MLDSQTALHYAPNANITQNGQYAPGVDGFNLADVSSVDAVNALPAGVQGLVWLGMGDGATSAFQNAVTPFIGNPNVYGFYLEDEPDPTGQYGPLVTAANLNAESNWIHAHDPGAKTFIVMMNLGTPTSPSYVNTYNPANTHIDLFGIDPYPVRPQFNGGVDYSVINDGVAAANAAGIPTSQIVPVYQAFGGGGYSSYTLPTPSQEQQLLSTWGTVVPHPAFDYAYSWGTQSGDSALANSPPLQQVFAAYNAASPASPPPLPPPPQIDATLTATDGQGDTASVPVITTGSLTFTGPLAGSVQQSVGGGIDTVTSTSITSEMLGLGADSAWMRFVSGSDLTVTGGSGHAVVRSSAGDNNFTAGTGTLEVTGGTGHDAYMFHAGDGLLRISDFSPLKGDTLTIDRALQGSMRQTGDGHGGTMLTFGATEYGIDLLGVRQFSAAIIHF